MPYKPYKAALLVSRSICCYGVTCEIRDRSSVSRATSSRRSEMKPELQWSDRIQIRKEAPKPIYASAIAPDGKSVLVGIGKSILIYDMANGEMTKQLKGHEGVIHCLAFSPDGKYFSSGDDEKVCYVWKTEGWSIMVQLSISDALQALSFSPITSMLAICGCMEFALAIEKELRYKHTVRLIPPAAT